MKILNFISVNIVNSHIKAIQTSLDKLILSIALAALASFVALIALYRYIKRPLEEQPNRILHTQNNRLQIQPLAQAPNQANPAETPEQLRGRTPQPGALLQNPPCFAIQELLEEGRTFYANKEYNQSIVALEKILENEPDHIEAVYWFAKNRQEIGGEAAFPNWQRVVDLLQQSKEPADFNACMFMGEAFFYLNKLNESLDKYLKALEVQPNNACLLQKIASIYTLQYNLDKASEYANKAAKINPYYEEYFATTLQARQDIEKLQAHVEQMSVPGKVRLAQKTGPLPTFDKIGGSIDTFELMAAGFSCCFHTTQSLDEIVDLLTKIRIAHPPQSRPFGCNSIGHESLLRIYNNLVRLHDALLGESTLKLIKIYWNEQAENELIPYLFNKEKIEINDLVFTLTSGEVSQSTFQSPEIDFKRQLQFVGIGKEKMFTDLLKGIKHFSQKIGGENILYQLEESVFIKHHEHPLINDAIQYNLLCNILFNIINFERQIINQEMTLEQKKEFLKNIIAKKLGD